MEMQSILTQVSGLFSTNSSESNTGSSKVEKKGGVAFQDYMSGASKKNELAVNKKQNIGDSGNTPVSVQQDTHNTLFEKSVDIMETSDKALISETEEVSVNVQDIPILNEFEENDNVEGILDNSAVVQNVVHEWKEEVQEVLCEEFDLTLEELEEIMTEIGVQLADLQNLSDIQQFVLAVAGTDDKSVLLTNEVLVEQVNLVEDTMKQITAILTQEYGMEDNELANYLMQDASQQELDNLLIAENMLPLEEENQTEVTVEENMVSVNKAETLFGSSTNKAESNLLQKKATVDTEFEKETKDVLTEESVMSLEESYTSDTKKTEMMAFKENVPAEVDSAEEKAESKIEITMDRQVEKVEESYQENEQQFSRSDKREDSTNLFEHFVENLSVNRTNDVQQLDVKLDAITQMREIVTQVVEQIKVHVSADTSSMEIQLNPENLGKVNLTVVAKEGHITAQFITENEIARQALDGQIQQLRETLGEQGLKVDEVEVTVSNFDFSHSNQANAEEQRQQHSQEQRRVHRNLNLNDTLNLNEMSEEEQLTAKIMTDNGNQVDYIA